MAAEVPETATPAAAISIASNDTADFDQRWTAWQAKGLAHDRALYRKMTIALPILIIVTGIVTYVLLGI